ncbi:hypothetical protein [Streptomyces murinus]|uniref:hypothetical protein n=1 Tax=Streptomyces murinus TaxID=33900 RepID=UPI002114E007|nr:hypothetical protein [Streptomyces murinus]
MGEGPVLAGPLPEHGRDPLRAEGAQQLAEDVGDLHGAVAAHIVQVDVEHAVRVVLVQGAGEAEGQFGLAGAGAAAQQQAQRAGAAVPGGPPLHDQLPGTRLLPLTVHKVRRLRRNLIHHV